MKTDPETIQIWSRTPPNRTHEAVAGQTPSGFSKPTEGSCCQISGPFTTQRKCLGIGQGTQIRAVLSNYVSQILMKTFQKGNKMQERRFLKQQDRGGRQKKINVFPTCSEKPALDIEVNVDLASTSLVSECLSQPVAAEQCTT